MVASVTTPSPEYGSAGPSGSDQPGPGHQTPPGPAPDRGRRGGVLAIREKLPFWSARCNFPRSQ